MTITNITRVSTAADGTQGNGNSSKPVFSPDGTKVAFYSAATNLVPGDTNNAGDVFVKTLATGAIERISTDATGTQGTSDSFDPVFSPDGTKVAFQSFASNLVAGDTNGRADIFVKDLTTGAISLVSTNSSGTQGNSHSGFPVFSPDGTKVAFHSSASNLVPGDTNSVDDIFVKDLATGTIERVSTNSSGTQGNSHSDFPVFSPDGNKVAFYGGATNLDPIPDANGGPDIFLKDLITGTSTRISTNASNTPGNGFGSEHPIFSPDGTRVAFDSRSTNLVPADTNNASDIFVKTLATGAIERISTDASGTQGNSYSYNPVFSPDGTKVAFNSYASNLVAGDTNGRADIFVKDLTTGAIERISTDASGVQGNSNSDHPVFSPDGTKVAFWSDASNLVAGDTNGALDIFVVTLGAPAQYSIAALAADKAEGNAGQTAFTFTVSRTGDVSQEATVDYAVTSTAADGTDFAGGTLPTGQVSFAGGEATATLTLDIAGDTTVEADEAFTVTLSNPSAGTLGNDSAGGSIQNDDSGISIAALDASKAEGNSGTTGFTFTVSRSGDVSQAATVDYAVTSTAADGTDFAGGTLPTGQVSFAGGEATATLTLDIAGDTTVEADEAFTVTLSNPSAGTLGNDSAQGSIGNDDSGISIAALDASKAEGSTGTTGFTFTVSRSGDVSQAATVDYAITSTAADGTDFAGGTLPTGQVSFAGGEATATLTLDIAGDTTVEPDEAFTVTLSNPSAGTLGNDSAQGSIGNDDLGISIAALDASKAEGNSGTTGFTFTVSRSGDVSQAATVDYAITSTAADGTDFAGGTLPTGQVSFAGGEATATLTLDIAGDTTVEPDEAFTVTLSNPSAGTLGNDSAQGSIGNDDLGISIAALDASKAEGNSGTTGFTFTVSRSGDVSQAATVDYAITSTAADGTDFAGGTLPTGQVSFAGGEATATLTLDIAGDTTVEPDEAFTVTLSNSTGATIGTNTADGLIQNDDVPPAPVLSIAALSASKAEGNSGTTPFTFTVTRTGDTSDASSVQYAVAGLGGNPADGSDFQGGSLPSGQVEFAATETEKTITLQVQGDTTVETDEAFTVTLSNSTGATIGTNTADGTIRNDDVPPAPVLSIAALSAAKAEGNTGTTPFTFTVSRSGDTSGASTVQYAVAGLGGNPADGSDFDGGSLPSGQVEFAATETEKTITLQVQGDTTVEPDEAFTVTLSNSTGATIGTNTADGEIQNDDVPPAPVLSIAALSASKAEGNTGTTPFTFTVSRTGDTSQAATVDYAVSSLVADGADFGGTLPSGQVEFAATETEKTLTLNVSGDTTVEPDEAFTVTLSNSTSATIGTNTADGLIQNDDVPPAPVLSIAALSASKAEGNSGTTPFTFTVTRTGDTSQAATVDYAVSSLVADGADFGGTLPSGQVEFAATETAKTLTLNVSGDTTVELDEAFTVTLSNSTGATIGTNAADGLIQNDDVPPAPVLSIAALSASKAEGNSGTTPFTFTVTRTGDTSDASSVQYAVAGLGGNPADGSDFQGGSLPSGQVEFAATETEKTITLQVQGDTTVETDEAFTVTLSNSTGATIGTNTADGTIRNDDVPPAPVLSIAALSAAKAEGNTGTTPFTFTVTRTGDTSQAATVDYAVSSLVADGADFAGGTLPTGQVSFAANEAAKTLTLNVSGDSTVEPDEAFTVTLSNPSAGTLGTATADGSIQNDDGGTAVSGTAGNDSLAGTSGDDSLFGLAGNDSIYGLAGNDTCVAGPGLDFFYGGPGADVCLFSPGEGQDKWWDYQDGIDKIALPAGLDYGDLTFRTDTTWNYLWVQSGGADVLGLKYISRSQIDASDFIAGTTPPSNVAPVANNNSAATTAGTAVEIAVLGNDTDANGDVLTIASFTQPANGSVVKDDQGTASTADDAFVYTPNSSFSSGTDTFFYTVSDGSLTDDATVTVTVGTAPPANTVPGTSGNDSLDGTSGNDFLFGLAGNDSIYGLAGNDTCVAGPGLDFFYGGPGADVCLFSPGEGQDKWWDYQDGSDKIALPAGIGYGDLTFRTDTTWNYLWVQSGGVDVLGLKYISRSQIDASDFITGTAPPSNVAPVANNNNAATTPGTAVEIAVLGNDTDANGDVLTIASFTQPANGNVVKDDQGTASTADDALVYTPNSSFSSGTDTFFYTVSDGSLTDDATVTVTVGTAPPANTVPGTSGNDSLDGTSGDDSLFGLAGNDSIYGLAGNDTCVAGPGLDFFYGGPGADVCLFSPGEGQDKWWDYQDGTDKIALPAGIGYGDLTFRTDTTWNYLWVQSGGVDVLGLKYISRSQIDASDFVLL